MTDTLDSLRLERNAWRRSCEDARTELAEAQAMMAKQAEEVCNEIEAATNAVQFAERERDIHRGNADDNYAKLQAAEARLGNQDRLIAEQVARIAELERERDEARQAYSSLRHEYERQYAALVEAQGAWLRTGALRDAAERERDEARAALDTALAYPASAIEGGGERAMTEAETLITEIENAIRDTLNGHGRDFGLTRQVSGDLNHALYRTAPLLRGCVAELELTGTRRELRLLLDQCGRAEEQRRA